ncbi:MAG: hypothetical protein WBF20_19370 [Trebonia sp.]|uniref:hypothetical protein n=1 Tax=Trebonia sp. TaxID=2767075 RepID=UPI003BAF0660
MSYQPYPGGTQMPEPATRPPVPQSITRAVQLMYAGAAASLIGIIIALTTLSSIKSQIISKNPSLTATQVNNAQHVAIGVLIASGLIGAALWLWMAQSSKAGKNWARIVSTVLFAIETINVVAGASAISSGGASRIYSIVIWLIGLGAIIFLWQRSSTEYFKAPHYQA